MKDILLQLLNEYLTLFPDEEERQRKLISFLQNHSSDEIVDWDNFDGHVVSGGFIYSKEDNKFLVLYHNDLKMFLYPGGHVNGDDKDILFAAKREILEETGLKDLEQLVLLDNNLVPIDIDTHLIGYNERLNLPEHYHFDFRYLFIVNKISDIKIDNEELSDFKWISIDELSNDPNYGTVASKLKKFLLENENKKKIS
jgi:8-oxo-dGTP pyrophosphatase MutT (NUDIX family)